MPLTDKHIRNAKSSAKPVYKWDDVVSGFGFRVTKTGVKTFVVLIGGGRRQTIGRYPLISLAEARAESKRILAQKTLGKIKPAHVSHDEAVAQYLEDCKSKNRPKTVEDYTYVLNRNFAFGRKSVGDISAREILRKLDSMRNTPVARRYAFVVGKTFYKWCVSKHIIDRSPMETLFSPPKSRSRERALDDNEIETLTTTLDQNPSTYSTIVLLLLLTGQRRGEVAALQWDWINLKKQTITFPASITKNKRTHVIPLGERVAAIIKAVPRIDNSPYLFPALRNRRKGKPSTIFNSWSKAKKDFDKVCELSNWTLHDLRRTFSSGMAALGIQQVVVENYRTTSPAAPKARSRKCTTATSTWTKCVRRSCCGKITWIA